MMPGKGIKDYILDTKRVYITLLGFLIFLTFNCFLLGEESFAPWATFIPGGDAITQEQKIPTGGEVGIPACPNAYVIAVSQLGDNKAMSVLHVVSKETPEAVTAFYRENLLKIAGWKWDDSFQVFHMGEDYMTAMGEGKPYIEIVAISLDTADMKNVDPSLKSTLKSRLQVVYNPKK
jgi:hypothetical protein